MNEKGNRYAISALKDKRATLAGEVYALKGKIARLQKQIEHVDATLALFDPELDPASIPLRKPRKHVNLFRQGELGRLILGALREAGRPVTIPELVQAILDKIGHGEEARSIIRRRVTTNLAYWRRKGQVWKEGEREGAVWGLAK